MDRPQIHYSLHKTDDYPHKTRIQQELQGYLRAGIGTIANIHR